VADQGIKHSDATSWRQGNQPRTLWTIATALVTVFIIVPDASMAGLRRQKRHVLAYLTEACQAAMRGKPAPSIVIANP